MPYFGSIANHLCIRESGGADSSSGARPWITRGSDETSRAEHRANSLCHSGRARWPSVFLGRKHRCHPPTRYAPGQCFRRAATATASASHYLPSNSNHSAAPHASFNSFMPPREAAGSAHSWSGHVVAAQRIEDLAQEFFPPRLPLLSVEIAILAPSKKNTEIAPQTCW